MSDPHAQPNSAGWYSDPINAAQLRWWNGTAWSEQTTPLPPVPSLPSEPAVAEIPAAATPGYNSVGAAGSAESIASGAADHRLGSAALADMVSAPQHTTVAAPSNFLDQAEGFLADNRVQGVGLGAVGAALIADGAVGIGKRKGIVRSSRMFIVGLFVVLFGLVGLAGGVFETFTGPTQATAAATVTKLQTNSYGYCIPTVLFVIDWQEHTAKGSNFVPCTWEVGDKVSVSYSLASGGSDAVISDGKATNSPRALFGGSIVVIVVGLVITVFGLVKLAVKAGSIAGGLLLVRQGLRRAKGSNQT